MLFCASLSQRNWQGPLVIEAALDRSSLAKQGFILNKVLKSLSISMQINVEPEKQDFKRNSSIFFCELLKLIQV